jgi:hypothetical protein
MMLKVAAKWDMELRIQFLRKIRISGHNVAVN